MPFVLYVRMAAGDRFALFRDSQVRLFLTIAAGACRHRAACFSIAITGF